MNVNDLLNKALNPNNGKYYITEDVLKDIKENFINKDKIRELFEQAINRLNDLKTEDGKNIMKAVIKILQELLEEE